MNKSILVEFGKADHRMLFQAVEAHPIGGIHIAYKGRFVLVNVLFHAEYTSTCKEKLCKW